MNKKNIFWLELFVVLLAAIMLNSCDNGNGTNNSTDTINGTWKKDNRFITYSGGDQWIHRYNSTNNYKGTFTCTGTSSGNLIFNFTHIIKSGTANTWINYDGEGTEEGKVHNCSYTINESKMTIVGSSWFSGTWIKQ